MTDKIEVIQVEEDYSETNKEVTKLSDIYWQDYLKEKNYNTDIDKMCELCIKDQKAKYGAQTIICNGLNKAKAQVNESLLKEMSEDELAEFDILYNPFEYMDKFLDFDKPDRDFQHRFYQKMILGCSARYKVVRMGRRCIAEYEEVLLSDGTVKPIRDLKVGDKIPSWNHGVLEHNEITFVVDNGVREVYRITLEDDRTIDCTSNHPLLLVNKDKTDWVSIEDGLKIEDNIYTYTGNAFIKAKIKDIRFLVNTSTYDISISNSPNFILKNGIVCHNTGKSQSIAMLAVHRAAINKTRILLVSPYAVQTEEIINTIKDICSRLPENPLVSSKASPAHKLTFSNGTILMGFTAATSGDSIRGQPADLIILDECLVGDTLITMYDGTKKQIKDIVIGDKVTSNLGTIDTVINSKFTGFKQTNKYIFDNGTVLEGTPNHPVKDVCGFVPVDDCSYIEVPTDDIKLEYLNYLSNNGYKDREQWEREHILNGKVYTKLINTEDIGIQEVYNLTIDNNHTYIANGLLTHNCDDIPEKAINSIMGIKMQNPEVEVWRSGTPKGQRNLHRAEQDPMAKSFHFPSFVIPNYSDQMDASLRADYGDGVGYIEEVLAEISSASNAVFQNIFISRALNKVVTVTASDVLQDRARFITFLGVDWNHDKVGSRILVLAYDKLMSQFYIIDKETVAIEGFTQHAAVEKIITLNRKYTCDHVFVDQGFGATQIADLKSFAMSKVGTVPKGHPDLRLLDVTPVDYGSATTIKDPVTGNEYKTPTKQLAVATAVEMFEKDLITLYKKEHHDIIQQLRNYVEVSRNKGRIVYGYISKKIGDHDLDALMIGIFGMKRIYSSLFINEADTALLKFSEKLDKEEELDTKSNDIVSLSFGNKITTSSRISGFKRQDRTLGMRRRGRGGF